MLFCQNLSFDNSVLIFLLSGGLMSVFLTGVYDPMIKKWCTVSKVGNGFDDKTLDRLQTELDMIKINKDMSKVPSWLNIKKHVVPDYIVADPLKAPVWEITGAEFSKAEIHTADGISIRFPRLTKMRDDKTWKEATNLPRLRVSFFCLFKSVKHIRNIFLKMNHFNWHLCCTVQRMRDFLLVFLKLLYFFVLEECIIFSCLESILDIN